MAARSVHEWHSWVFRASMSGSRRCSERPWVRRESHGYSARPRGALVGAPKVARLGAQSVLERHSWVCAAATSGTYGRPQASMSGSRGCSQASLSGTHACSEPLSGVHGRSKRPGVALMGAPKCQRVALIGAASLHEWRSGVLQAPMCGAPGCSKCPRMALMGA